MALTVVQIRTQGQEHHHIRFNLFALFSFKSHSMLYKEVFVGFLSIGVHEQT